MSHRISRGKRRWLAGALNGPLKGAFVGGIREQYPQRATSGKLARREGRHHDGQKMSEPCQRCARRIPTNRRGRGRWVWCRRCDRWNAQNLFNYRSVA